MSFIAVQPPEQTETAITSDPFWPEIKLVDLRYAMRLDGTVTDERLKHAAIDAVISANRDLEAYRQRQTIDGYGHLEEVPAAMINGKSELCYLYRRAVYSHASANLIERLRDYDSTKQGETRAESLDQTIIDLRRDARFSIRKILGITHTTVELI